MNRSLERKIGFQATVRAGKSLTVVFRPLPQSTRGRIRARALAADRGSASLPLTPPSIPGAGVVPGVADANPQGLDPGKGPRMRESARSWALKR